MPKEGKVWSGKSPWVAIYKAQHERAGLNRWNNDRVYKVCNLLGCDVYTLCAACGMVEPKRVAAHLQADKWPTEMSIHFSMHERFALGTGHRPTAREALIIASTTLGGTEP